MHCRANEFWRLCAKESQSSVGKRSIDGIDNSAQEDTIEKSDVQEHGETILIDTCVENLGQTDGGGRCSEGLYEREQARLICMADRT